MTPTIRPLGEEPGLRLSGEIDLATRPVLEAALRTEIHRNGSGNIHLDLTDVAFIDVGCITAIARATAQLPAGTQIVLHNPPAELRRILDLLWADLSALRVS